MVKPTLVVLDATGYQGFYYHFLDMWTGRRSWQCELSTINSAFLLAGAWQHRLEQKWATLHFGEVKVETRDEQHIFEVQVFLNELDPKAVRVELYADSLLGSAPVRQEMKRLRPLAGASGGFVYSSTVSSIRSPADYTARVIPHCKGVAIPLEDARILWQR